MLTNAIDRCISASTYVQSVDDFKAWVRDHVRPIIPSEFLACGHGRITSSGVLMDQIVLVDFPPEYLLGLKNAAGGIDTPLMRRWLATRRPVYFDAAAPWPDVDPEWHATFIARDLRNGVADAVYDEGRCIGTYFSFHRLPVVDMEFLEIALPRLTPVLHRTLMRAVADAVKRASQASAAMARLSQREQEVAKWIGMGKSNGEIAQLASISENTVRNYLCRIMEKTECSNRTNLAVLVSRWDVLQLGIGTNVL
ncbi:helix-turn-helix transcriptional regulator [Ralstonia solanacearum]|uniref:helix-turn-helix transcriptional regulator n=1 Tax=Ralstonia solanacearum TaxID=305 RepID=UPI00078E36E6|nr:LuxR C-terminal-related transcriptional regulator [Ralstonia solanacearum]AMP37470.1 helix-turn-helix transcriptional regulator [Ralstonia solanacearum]AXV86296.1 helix-turn-helix transcriptional regulator [Ralstonia solanacearum]AXW05802.1 helix-turn-helix transcriptional regulator [Ralstonia solanacearum]AXW23543.1 helix-turn-helix transcriptional regulator [Ralstonia solanacearum]AXW80475.1 helix-turn-helix transcriptional regulator [Ralstonia solanacearum]